MSTIDKTNNLNETSDLTKEATDANSVIAEEARKVGLNKVSSWRGPLPPQVIEKISPDVADEMVRSLCRRQERQDDIVEKIIENKRIEIKSHNATSLIQTITIGCFCIAILLICFHYQNTELIFKLIETAALIIGGSGVTLYFQKKSSNKEKHPIIEIE